MSRPNPGRAAVAALRELRASRKALAAEGGFVVFTVVDQAIGLALLLYAFERGGAREAGQAAFGLLVPAALAAIPLSWIFHRMLDRRALAAALGGQAVLATLTGAAMAFDGPPTLVYSFGAVLMAVATVPRPAVSALLPSIVDTPGALAAANSLVGLSETVGTFGGPTLAVALLVFGGPAAVLFAAAPLLTLAAALSWTVGSNPEPADPTGRPRPSTSDRQPGTRPAEATGPWNEALSGLRVLRADGGARAVVSLLVCAWVVYGALEVGFVIIAVELLGRPAEAAGLLAGLLGLGGAVGAAGSLGLAGARRLTGPLAVGVVVVGLTLALTPLTRSAALVGVAVTVCGAGIVLTDVAGRSLLQAMTAEDTLAQVFGVFQALGTAGLGIGGFFFSAVSVRFGLSTALLATGLLPVLLLALVAGRLLRVDRARPVVDLDLLARVRRIPIFAPLPAFQLEQLLVNLDPEHFDPEEPVIHRGEEGQRFYVVSDGSAVVELPDRHVELGPGQFFGEIALLFDMPRSATVRAGPDGLRAHRLRRSTFLDAISSHPRAWARTVDEADRRLDEQRSDGRADPTDGPIFGSTANHRIPTGDGQPSSPWAANSARRSAAARAGSPDAPSSPRGSATS